MYSIIYLNSSEADILYAFVRKTDLKISILQIANEIKKHYPNIYNSVKKLQKNGLLKIETIGKANICSLNVNSLELPVYLAFVDELNSLQILDKLPFLQNIINEAKRINPVVSIGVFGSYASGTETKKSDIDLFILTDKVKEFKDFIPKYFPEFENKIDLNVISFEEFIASLKSKQFTVSKEIVKSKRILTGAEIFYQILLESNK